LTDGRLRDTQAEPTCDRNRRISVMPPGRSRAVASYWETRAEAHVELGEVPHERGRVEIRILQSERKGSAPAILAPVAGAR
jgi:hypothetical protein